MGMPVMDDYEYDEAEEYLPILPLWQRLRARAAGRIRMFLWCRLPRPVFDRIYGRGAYRINLEDTLFALHVTQFPTWDRLPHSPAKGTAHHWDTL